MNWAEVAKKNNHKKVKRYQKEEIRDRKKTPIDLYPEDLFEMKYIDEIRKLNTELNKELYATGAELLNYNYKLHDLYEFIVYHTDLNTFTEELLNEEPKELLKTELSGENYYEYHNKNIVLHKDDK